MNFKEAIIREYHKYEWEDAIDVKVERIKTHNKRKASKVKTPSDFVVLRIETQGNVLLLADHIGSVCKKIGVPKTDDPDILVRRIKWKLTKKEGIEPDVYLTTEFHLAEIEGIISSTNKEIMVL